MIVCVLLVSISRGCCLAAPGDHEGEFDTNNTHTIMFDPLNKPHGIIQNYWINSQLKTVDMLLEFI